MRKIAITLAAAAAVLPLLAACQSSSTTAAKPSASAAGPSSSATPSATAYDPKIDPATFTTTITNPYFPLKPGTKAIYDGTKDGVPQHVEVSVLPTTRTILGVRCVVVSDVVTSKKALAEKTTDWYAQDAQGNVWYFGEDSKDYTNGVVTSTHGTWEAGVDNAKPGIIMQANPQPGDFYRQEYRPKVAEDIAKIIQLNATLRLPARTYTNVLVTEDRDPLNPDLIQHKSYAPGIGMIKTERLGNNHHELLQLTKIVAG
jgi:hypothetical protein